MSTCIIIGLVGLMFLVWKNGRVDPRFVDAIRKKYLLMGWQPPRAEDTQFTAWGKYMGRPVSVTYDRGKLKGDPEVIKEIQYMVNQIKTGKDWTHLVIDDLFWRQGPLTIDTPLGYKAAIQEVMLVEKWEGNVPEEPPRGVLP